MERIAVAERMRRRYGWPFAQQFLEVAPKGKPHRETTYYGRGLGPNPSELIKQGYRRGWIQLVAAYMAGQWWVHPSGRYIAIDIRTWKSTAAETKKAPGAKPTRPTRTPPPGEVEVEPPPLTEGQINALDFLDDLPGFRTSAALQVLPSGGLSGDHEEDSKNN
jgi:hypothetical protein